MEIRSLADTAFDTLYEAFSQAFADYEVQINGAQLRRMLKRRGFDPRLSFAAFDGDRIAAFTLNGIGNYDGLPTAYDTGTGTLEAYRGQGLATRIFEHSIPYLKEAGYRPIPAGGPPAQHQSRFGLSETRVRSHARIQLFLAGAGGGRCPCKGVPKPLYDPTDRYPGL